MAPSASFRGTRRGDRIVLDGQPWTIATRLDDGILLTPVSGGPSILLAWSEFSEWQVQGRMTVERTRVVPTVEER